MVRIERRGEVSIFLGMLWETMLVACERIHPLESDKEIESPSMSLSRKRKRKKRRKGKE